MKQLGIIIPAYNVERSLQNLLNTLVQQITDNVEVIVIDDGSQDNTLATASRFANENISVIHQDNQGVGKARNLGIETCKAEYLWFVDADDSIRTDAVPSLLNAIRQESFDCYLFGLEKVRGRRVTQIVNASDICLTSNEAIAEAFDTIFSENLLNPLWNKLFRRSVIEQHQIHFSSIPSGEDAEFVLHYLTYADSMHVLPMVLYQYTLMSATSSSHAYHPSYIADHVQMFGALAEYCAATGAMADNVKHQWQRETYLGACQNIFNSLLPKPSYREFARKLKLQLPALQKMVASIYSSTSDMRIHDNNMVYRIMYYLHLKFKYSLNNINCLVKEVSANVGLLPKVVVIIYRFGSWANNIQVIPMRIIIYSIYRVIDLLFCKLLLNCDVPAKTHIGYGFTIYHPYGVIINSDAVIGRNFTCRAQIVVGNKGTGINDGSPVIGDNVTLGAGAKLIGPISVGSNCCVGANSVVTHSFPPNRVLVGVPAKALKRS